MPPLNGYVLLFKLVTYLLTFNLYMKNLILDNSIIFIILKKLTINMGR
jgi:hypothetical protein